MSNSQKALKVISIIMIVLGVIYALLGIVMLAGAGLTDISSQTVEVEGTAINLGAGALVVGVMFIVCFAIYLIIGIMGLRGANDPQKIGVYWVFCLIGVILSAIQVISSLASGQGASGLVGLVVVVVCFVLANNIKKENS